MAENVNGSLRKPSDISPLLYFTVLIYYLSFISCTHKH